MKQGYTKGASRTLARMARLFKGIPSADLVESVIASPFHRTRLQSLYTRNFNELRGINDAMGQAVSRELTDGLAAGIGPLPLARRLAGRVDGIGIARARTMARTEIIRANAEGQLATFEQFGALEVNLEAEFQTVGDDDVCPQCLDLEADNPYTIEEARGIIPVHPNCLPGDCLVSSGGRITAATKRLYEGDLVVIRTASGHKLACTPNHPVLTDRGWVPAKAIDKGGRVVRHVRGQEPAGGGEHEEQQGTSRVEDVFRTVRESGEESFVDGSAAQLPRRRVRR